MFGQLIPLANLLPRKPPNKRLQSDRRPFAALSERERPWWGGGP